MTLSGLPLPGGWNSPPISLPITPSMSRFCVCQATLGIVLECILEDTGIFH